MVLTESVYSQVVLLVGAKGVIDVPLEVDGQVGDPEDGPGDVDQPMDETASALDHDSAGHGQVAVEPGAPDASSVALHRHLEEALLGLLRPRFDLDVTMRRGDA